MRQDTVQFVEAVVADFQLALAATRLPNSNTRTEFVRQIGFKALYVGGG